MNNAENIISTLETCFNIFVAFTVLFFVISVVLFFLFDIRTIFSIKTGRAKSKTIKEMQEVNSKTGRLRVGGKTVTAQLTEKDREVFGTQQPNPDSPPVPEYENTAGSAETEVLSTNNSEYFPDTPPTEQLSNMTADEQNNNRQIIDVHFQVYEKNIVVHSDEMIV